MFRPIVLNPNLSVDEVDLNETSEVTPVTDPTDLDEMIMVTHLIEDKLVLELLCRFVGLQLLRQHLLDKLTIFFNDIT